MKIQRLVWGFLFLLPAISQGETSSFRWPKKAIPHAMILKAMYEHPESLCEWRDSRIYLREETLHFMSKEAAFLSCHPNRTPVYLPHIGWDDLGWFILCRDRDPESGPNKEAEEHYSRAREALIDALGHSALAGLSLECPPAAVFEGYNAVKSWKEMAREYNAGVESERVGTWCPPEPKSSRDD